MRHNYHFGAIVYTYVMYLYSFIIQPELQKSCILMAVLYEILFIRNIFLSGKVYVCMFLLFFF